MTLPHQLIRPAFVAEYIRRHDERWARQMEMISVGDNLQREINRRYGYVEADGTFSASIRSHIDRPYVDEMNVVEVEFKSTYDGLSIAERETNRRAGMTIYEYLLLEDVRDKETYLEAASDPNYYRWIELKARTEIDHIKHNAFSDIQRLVDIKKSHFRYAGKRCREFFGIKPWDVGGQRAIFSFSREFDRQLRSIMGNLRGV